MNITKIFEKSTPGEIQEVMDVATPTEKVWFGLAQSGGVEIHTSEMAPDGVSLAKLLEEK